MVESIFNISSLASSLEKHNWQRCKTMCMFSYLVSIKIISVKRLERVIRTIPRRLQLRLQTDGHQFEQMRR